MTDRRTKPGRRLDDNKLHWLKFYLNDWSTSYKVQMMGPIARAWYLELLILQWRNGYVSDSDQSLLRYLKQMPRDPSHLVHAEEDDSNDYEAILKQVKECFEELEPGKLVNIRMKVLRDQTLAEMKAKSEGAQRANAKRYSERSLTALDSDSDTDTEVKPLPANAGTIRARQMSPEFEPKESHRALATTLGVELADEFVAFSDFHRSKGSRFIDWDKALNTWLRTARRFAGRVAVNGGSNGKPESDKWAVASERVAARLRETD